MSCDFPLLANEYIRNLTPYQPGKPIEELERELGITSAIKLASNENALGASPLAREAAQTALLESHLYPDGSCFELKKTLSQFLKINSNQLTIGNGSENILEIIVKAYLSKGDAAIVSQYAFLTISLLIKSYGGDIQWAEENDHKQSIQNIIAAITPKTRIIFIVNPNNPTGTYLSADELHLLLESIPATILVVIDEAYFEYIKQPDYPMTLSLLPRYPNLIITRTFSKVYGLAALRLGYAISSATIADILNRARLPFNVNRIAAMAAIAGLQDQNHIQKSIEMNFQGMEQVTTTLRSMKVQFIPSIGNFMMIHVQQNAELIYQKLLQQGIIVRPLFAYHLPHYLRVTIGTTAQNERFLSAFSQIIRDI